MVVFEQDSLSGTSPGVLTPSLVQRVPTGDRDLRAENRTYDVVDVAGNTLQLVHSTGLTTDTVVAGIQTLRYNGGPVTRPPYSLLYFEWRLKGNASDSLDQTFFVSSPLQSASATWRAKDNLTRITSTVGGATTTTTVPGMFLLRLGTNNGALAVETTP